MRALTLGKRGTVIIRQEKRSDFPEIYELVRDAFRTARYAEGDEQDFVERQRSPEVYIPELALVVEQDRQLIAHLMLTRMFISTSTGRRPVLLLACVAVVAGRRDQGIGTMLIEEALQRARELGHTAAIVVGNPAYYSRLGFMSSAQFGITNENRVEQEYVQLLELVPGTLRDMAGTVLLPT